MSRPRRVPGTTVLGLHAETSLGSKAVYFGTSRSVVKYDDDEPGRSALVAVEFICSRLAMMVGLPVPMGDAAELQRGERRPHKAWVSSEVVLEGVTLPPPDPREVLGAWPDDLAGTFVFDVWVCNDDRTDENVLFHKGVGFWMIDHENALGGDAVSEPARLQGMVDRIPSWHLLDPRLLPSAHRDEWARRIRGNARQFAEIATEEAWRRRLITREQQDAIVRLLTDRGDRLHQLVRRSVEAHGRGGDEAWMSSSEPGDLFSSLPTSGDESPGTSA